MSDKIKELVGLLKETLFEMEKQDYKISLLEEENERLVTERDELLKQLNSSNEQYNMLSTSNYEKGIIGHLQLGVYGEKTVSKII
jgi:bifunctional ADP-heptose synthase (sugar kinase/adenylyltransferase)